MFPKFIASFAMRTGLSARMRAAVFIAATLLGAISVAGAQQPIRSSELKGTVRDSQGKPLAAATVFLQTREGTKTSSAQTDTAGKYAFSGLPEGTYTVRTDIGGYEQILIPSIFLGMGELKNLDLTVTSKIRENSPPNASPQFFDEPHFTISGVTDTTSLGGHGSDTVVKAREGLAKDTASLGKSPEAPDSQSSIAEENALRKQVELEPSSFKANHALGMALMAEAKSAEAIPFLRRAAEIEPNDYENAYHLAFANLAAGYPDAARDQAQALLSHHESAALHHVLADAQEQLGHSLEAVREFQRAAEIEPSEPYLFDWGSELLLHHAPEPAMEVFLRGHKLFSQSVRMLLGIAAASFGRGDTDEAVRRAMAACDVSPSDSAPYIFLGKIVLNQSPVSDSVVERLRRFAELRPESVEANYYYAIVLQKRGKAQSDPAQLATAELLLQNAVRLDPKFGSAYLQLGILHSDQGDFAKAIDDYRHAVETSTDVEEAHYRLAQAYRATGQPEQAKAELRAYSSLAKESAAKNERERREVRQFLYTLRDPTPVPR